MAQRSTLRHACSIEAFACTPIDSRAARIVDLSRRRGQAAARRAVRERAAHPPRPGRRILRATVMWSEVDRMGRPVHSAVTAGVLHDRLNELQARSLRPPPSRVHGFGPPDRRLMAS